MTKRRDFIRELVVGGIGVGLLSGYRMDEPLPKLGWNNLRSLFPFPQELHYMNSGTMGLSPIHVTHAYKQAIDEINQTGSYDRYRGALQEKLASFLNCKRNELAMTANVSEGINIAVWSLPLKAGDEVILSDQEHAGNAIPWLNRAQRDGLKIRVAKIGKTGSETVANIAALVTQHTRVIAVPHITCTTGTILPISQIASLARSANAYSVIDGAHAAGMLELNLGRMGVDFYASCFHKWMLGPKGSGWLYVNSNTLGQVASTYVGAYSDLGWSFEGGKAEFKGIKRDDAGRYTYGTQSDPIFAASMASIDFLEGLGTGKVARHIRKLGASLCEQLIELPGVEVLTSTKSSESAGIISFQAHKVPSKQILDELTKAHFRVRSVRESGMDHIRVSTHIYNSQEEVDQLVAIIGRMTHAH